MHEESIVGGATWRARPKGLNHGSSCFRRLSLAVACSSLFVGPFLVAAASAEAASPRSLSLSAKAGKTTIVQGSELRVSGRVRRARGTVSLVLQQRSGKKWRTLQSGRASKRGAYAFRFRPTKIGKLQLRVRARNGSRTATSQSFSLRVTRKRQPRPKTTTPVPRNPGSPSSPTSPGPSPDRTPLSLRADPVEVVVGAQRGVMLPSPLEGIESMDRAADLPAGVTAATAGSALKLAAASTSPPLSAEQTVTITGKGCTAAGGCDHPLTLIVPVTVRGLDAPPGNLDEFTAAGPDRLAAATEISQGGKLLQDELVITLGTPDAPGTRAQAESAAASVDGTVSGGVESLGMYEVRWSTTQDLDARRRQLLAQPNVTSVSTSPVGIFRTDAVEPSDWSDDGAPVKWPFRVTRATTAWEQTTGNGVPVGIVDGGQAYGHEDLNISRRIGSNGIEDHATHVAGTACAVQNGTGLVGFSWGCPIITSGWNDNSIKGTIQAMTDVAAAGAKVINMSLGWGFDEGCAPSQGAQDDLIEHVRQWRNDFRTLMRGDVGRNVVWTLSAGNNCAAGVASPFGLNADLGNVITVAAINSDAKLSNFSAFGDGVEVAAPGGAGVGSDGGGPPGIWSTTVSRCFVFFRCSTYGVKNGTSMAAPAVAGVAALVRAEHPSFGASRVAGCIVGSAGTGVGSVTERSPDVPFPGARAAYSGTIPIMNAQAAVDCESLQFSAGPGTGPPPSTLGGHPMTAFSPDDRPISQLVDAVTDRAGTIGFSPSLSHFGVGNGWATWSHGYTGDVYFTGSGGEKEVEITMPPGTKAFSFYAEPNTFARFTAEAVASDGTSSEAVEIEGRAGAKYFGFHGSAGRTVASITVKASDPGGFAVGEFMISR